MLNSDMTYKLLKYVVEGIIIYALFKFVPKEPIMSDKDILSLTIIIVLVYAVFENLYSMYFKENKTVCSLPKPEQVPAEAPKKETMGNVTSNANNLSDQVSQLSNTVARLQNSIKTLSVMQNPNTNVLQGTNLNPVPTASPPVSTTNGMTVNQNGQYTIPPQTNPQAVSVGSRAQDGVMKNETQFSYIDLNSLPNVSPLNTGSFEQGYSYLPPSQWFPVPPHPPVCVAEKQCPVCPVTSSNTTLDLKEWDSSRRVSPPDQINVQAIEQKLNSGR